MSDTIDPELCSLITNVCKPPQILTFQKLSSPLGLFGLKSFHGFVILGGRIERIDCLVFCLVIKMWENPYKKSYQKWQTAVKAFKKHQNVLTGTHKRREKLFHRFLGEYTLFLSCLYVYISRICI